MLCVVIPDLHLHNADCIPEMVAKQHLLTNQLHENVGVAWLLLAFVLQHLQFLQVSLELLLLLGRQCLHAGLLLQLPEMVQLLLDLVLLRLDPNLFTSLIPSSTLQSPGHVGELRGTGAGAQSASMCSLAVTVAPRVLARVVRV